MRGAIVRGIDPAEELKVTPLAAQMAQSGLLGQLQPGEWRIVLGGELARQLGAHRRQVTLVAPGGQVTPAGVVPRLKSFTWPAPSTPGTMNTTAAWR
jgi:lipoprotein-releasing system permease protein